MYLKINCLPANSLVKTQNCQDFEKKKLLSGINHLDFVLKLLITSECVLSE